MGIREHIVRPNNWGQWALDTWSPLKRGHLDAKSYEILRTKILISMRSLTFGTLGTLGSTAGISFTVLDKPRFLKLPVLCPCNQTKEEPTFQTQQIGTIRCLGKGPLQPRTLGTLHSELTEHSEHRTLRTQKPAKIRSKNQNSEEHRTLRKRGPENIG